ncbi:efflux RND transporter permease subunit [Kangiella sp. HZ709]|uniref:efflux RND transporter permease subunit n=1 Tax=Kangiella sp. HZ709 TaxID=2666328 RepID=UPI0012AFB9EB|nr:efflux RND transporter permease subunit [Kangiella sp. HZ709]MRX27598.1 AcrB/AcrD/AcrF family protein [Kangiella sp. HZ709]
MIAWFARNPVAANMLMVVILLAGAFTIFKRVTVERFPSIEINTITVTVPFRGASPEEAERTISTRVEEAVFDLEGIDKLRSVSSEGSSTVIIEIEDSYDMELLLDKVKSRVDALNTLPVEAERPIIRRSEFNRETISVMVSGELPEQELREYADILQEEMLTIEGITQIETSGVRAFEIAIEVNQDLLNEYGLTLQEIANAINNDSLDLSAGQVRSDKGDILLRLKGQSYTQREFLEIPILTQADGTRILLKDIARIKDGFEEQGLNTRFDGRPAIELEIFRVGDQSEIQVAQKIKDFVTAKQGKIPAGLEVGIWRDQSKGLKARLSTLNYSLLQGGILVIILLTLFLRPTIALWVSLGIPIAFAGGIALMPEMGATVNLISLFAFILVLGIVVDDAIVTGENIYNHLSRGSPPLEAAINGTKEVAVPVTFGIITTMIAFVPILFLPGGWGKWYFQLPLIVIPVLFFSLVESKLILPAHLGHMKFKKKQEEGNAFQRFQQKFANGFEAGIVKFYKPVLNFAISHWAITVTFFIGLLYIIYFAVSLGHTKFSSFPRIPSETARNSLSMPAGTPFEVTDDYIQRITNAAIELKEKYRDTETGESVITHVFSVSGAGGRSASPNRGRVMFETIPPEERANDVSIGQLVREWRQLIGPLPGAETLNFRAEIGRSRDPIDIQLSGADTIQLNQAAEQIKTILTNAEGVFDIADSFSKGKQEIQFDLKPQAEALGVNLSSLARQVRSAFFGVEVQRIQRGRDDVRVMLRLSEEERSSLDELKNLLVQVPNGGKLPLHQLADLSYGNSPSSITRIDRRRTINITADVDKANSNILTIREGINNDVAQLLENFPGIGYSLEGEAREESELFSSIYVSILFVMLAIYVLLAIVFKSYHKPFIVMAVIPLGAVMAVLGHWLMGLTLSMMSILGMLALTGVVVNDSLVLVDYINKQREKGIARKEAVLNAGIRRLRPIMLTSLTTFVGLIPIIFDKSTQAQFLIPMGVSLGFGILFATAITLILVPLFYYRVKALVVFMLSFAALLGYQYQDWILELIARV